MTTNPPPEPNAPCPCGSGRKYKHCCARQAAAAEGSENWRTSKRLNVLLIVLLVAIVGLWVMSLLAGGEEGASANGGTPGMTPAPWTYDAENDRHWDPAHNHWHDGPPPEGAPQPPAAWEYDVESDRHWHPEHRHWHDGPPPAESER